MNTSLDPPVIETPVVEPPVVEPPVVESPVVEMQDININEEESKEEEPKVEESKPKIKYQDVVLFIQLLLSTVEQLKDFMEKANIQMDETQSIHIKNALSYLINDHEVNKNKQITHIIDEVVKVLEDNKVELYEIPQLINVVHESLKATKSLTLKTSDLGILIKTILFILIDTQVIKMSNVNYVLISKVIDTSMVLLHKSIEIKFPKKCFCFYTFSHLKRPL
jgi:hypothetical protein